MAPNRILTTHDTTRIDDTRIGAVRPLMTPALLQERQPLGDTAAQFVEQHRREIADVLHVSARKIDRLKRRFVEDGFDLALDGGRYRSNYERLVDGDLEAHLVALSCSEPPPGRSRWTLKLLADKAVELNYVEAISGETVRRTLKKTNLSLGRRSAG